MNWRRFFRRGEADAEQHEELDFYLDVTTEEYIERGMNPAATPVNVGRDSHNSTANDPAIRKTTGGAHRQAGM